MRAKSSNAKPPAEQVFKDIRRKTRRHLSAEDKIRIVLEGLRGDDSIAELCGRMWIEDRPAAETRTQGRTPFRRGNGVPGA